LFKGLLGLTPMIKGLAEHGVVADRVDPTDRAPLVNGPDRAIEAATERALSVAQLAAIELLNAYVVRLRRDRIAELGLYRCRPNGGDGSRARQGANERQPASRCLHGSLLRKLPPVKSEGGAGCATLGAGAVALGLILNGLRSKCLWWAELGHSMTPGR
jgi:hypothetical protein